MPLFGFQCTACQFTEERFFHIREATPVIECEKCGARSERNLLVEASNHRPGSAWPMVTSHLTGKPETFANQGELDRRCKELGIRHRPDSAFLTKEVVGMDRRGNPIYKESSGVGEKGCWV